MSCRAEADGYWATKSIFAVSRQAPPAFLKVVRPQAHSTRHPRRRPGELVAAGLRPDRFDPYLSNRIHTWLANNAFWRPTFCGRPDRTVRPAPIGFGSRSSVDHDVGSPRRSTAGVWFRRARLLIVSPDSLENLARRQAETPLIALSRFPEPALTTRFSDLHFKGAFVMRQPLAYFSLLEAASPRSRKQRTAWQPTRRRRTRK